MNQNEMCDWLGVSRGTPVPRKVAEVLGQFRVPVTPEEGRALVGACLAWTPPRMPLPQAQPAPFNASTKTWAGFSF